MINKKTNEEFAIKQVKKETINVMKQADHLISEVKTLKSNDTSICPFVVGHVATFKDKENVYIQMEYVSGCTLYNHMTK